MNWEVSYANFFIITNNSYSFSPIEKPPERPNDFRRPKQETGLIVHIVEFSKIKNHFVIVLHIFDQIGLPSKTTYAKLILAMHHIFFIFSDVNQNRFLPI